MPMTTWREIRRCRDEHEAAGIASTLAAGGIEALVPDPRVMGIQAGCRPRPTDVRVLVREEQFDAAVARLASPRQSADS
jgi:hypothetical protein